MNLFSKSKALPGWMAIGVQEAGVCAAYVKRLPGAKPVVEVLASYPAATEKEALTVLAKELQINQYRCSNLLSGNEYQLLSIDAPNVPPDELKTAVRWRLKDLLDFHIDDATIDVLDVPADKNAGNRAHAMYAVAARNQLIEQRQTLFSDARIPLRVIDIPETAQRNIAALLEPENRGLALLSFDAEGGLLTISYAGELYLSRRIDVHLAALDESDESIRHGLLDRITLELQRSLDHFDRQYHSITLAKMMIGPVGNAAGFLLEHLKTNLYLPVELLDLADIFNIDKFNELRGQEAQQRFFLILGAALRHEETTL